MAAGPQPASRWGRCGRRSRQRRHLRGRRRRASPASRSRARKPGVSPPWAPIVAGWSWQRRCACGRPPPPALGTAMALAAPETWPCWAAPCYSARAESADQSLPAFLLGRPETWPCWAAPCYSARAEWAEQSLPAFLLRCWQPTAAGRRRAGGTRWQSPDRRLSRGEGTHCGGEGRGRRGVSAVTSSWVQDAKLVSVCMKCHLHKALTFCHRAMSAPSQQSCKGCSVQGS